MAHFAKIENNKVTQVIAIQNDDCGNLFFPDSESHGQKFIKSIGLNGHWLQTSYNKTFRKHYAATGFTYDKTEDAFLPPKPFDSWILDKETYQWISPNPMPVDGTLYLWDEDSKSWIKHPNYDVE